jgi:thiol-disulfide isomerase/thioredoxin
MNPVQQKLYYSGFEVFKNGLQAPDFTVKTLKDQSTTLSSLKGSVVLVNLWATWCPPCRKEMPSIENLYKKYKNKNFKIMAISSGEEKKTVTDFLKKTPYSFPIYLDPDDSAVSQYSTGSIPSTYLIDKNGNAVARLVGAYEWDSPEFSAIVDELLAQ